MAAKRRQTGIYEVHARKCASRPSVFGDCDCEPTWQAYVPAPRPGERAIRKNFKRRADAKRWREDALVAARRGELRQPSKRTLREAFDELLAGMKDGTARTRSGGLYKPSTIRSYERGRDRIVARLGAARLSDVRRRDVQDVIDAMLAEGWSASLIHNTLDPLRVVYRRALRRDEVTVDPTKGLDVPADRGRRDRFATASEAATLLAALPDEQRPLWATAFYTGMRRGELRELRWSDVELKAGVIGVARALDDEGTVIDTKTRAGVRTIPLLGALKPVLAEHKLRTGRDGEDLVFGRTAREPFVPSTIRRRAIAAWEAAGLEPIALHEARHSTASLLRSAGLDFKLISAIIGHASVAITFDRYTHLSPENLSDAAAQVDAYLAASVSRGAAE